MLIARLQYLQCDIDGDTTILPKVINIDRVLLLVKFQMLLVAALNNRLWNLLHQFEWYCIEKYVIYKF